MTRIRYKKEIDGSYVSLKKLIGTHDIFTVKITGLTFTVLNGEGQAVAGGTGKNDAETKRLAKLELKNLGVQFSDEVKKKKRSQSAQAVQQTQI